MGKLFSVLILVLFLTSCQEKSVSDVKSELAADLNTVETLEFLVYANQGMMSNYETVLKKFNDSHKDIQVKIHNVYGEDWTDYEQTFRSYLLSGKTPDIVDLSVIYRDTMIDEGLIMDLMPFAVKAGLDFDQYFCNQFDGLLRGDSLYGIPSGAMLMGVFINKDLFRRAGVTIPSTDWENSWSFDEFADAARKISDLSTEENPVYGMTMSFSIGWILPFLMGNGSPFLSEESVDCTALAPESVEVFQFLTDLMFRDKVSPGIMELISLQPNQYFIDGTLGMIVEGNWWMEGFRDSADFDWGIVPMPRSKIAATGMYVDCWAIPSASTKGEAAFEVLRFLLEEEQQKSGVMKGIPLLKTSAEDIYRERFSDLDDEEIQLWFEGLDYGHVPAYFQG